MAKYIIAGKTITVDKFILDRPKTYFTTGEEGRKLVGEKLINCRTKKIFYRIDENDTIILLAGWWGRSWAKQGIKDALIMFPQIKFEYHDGKFGPDDIVTRGQMAKMVDTARGMSL